MPKRVLISCGELSGDEHSAHLANSLKKLLPDCEIKAMGGRNLRNCGVETIVDSESSASVMGFTEIITSLSRVFAALGKMKKCLAAWKPDLLILVDNPEFNLKLAKHASKLGIKTLYFISPKVWAWRAGRIKSFAQYLNHIALIFPFEKDFLEKNGYSSSSFVGHPFLDYLKDKKLRAPLEIRHELGLTDKPVLAVFPGSRKPEIEKHLDLMLAGLKKFSIEYPDVQLVLNVAPSLEIDFIDKKIEKFAKLKIVKRDPVEIMQIADAGLLKSGTSNLQAAILGLPFCMFYVASPLSAFIVRKFVKLSQYSIVNILSPDSVQEILQENATPDNIYNEIKKLLFDRQYRQDMKIKFEKISHSLEFPGVVSETACDRTAKIALSLMS
jgi:lipid-A-disaccharide synthase